MSSYVRVRDLDGAVPENLSGTILPAADIKGSALVILSPEALTRLTAAGGLPTDAGPARAFRPLDISGDIDFGTSTRGFYVGTAGDVKVDGVDEGMNAVTGAIFKNCPAGSVLPIVATKLYGSSNGTTAADIMGLW